MDGGREGSRDGGTEGGHLRGSTPETRSHIPALVPLWSPPQAMDLLQMVHKHTHRRTQILAHLNTLKHTEEDHTLNPERFSQHYILHEICAGLWKLLSQW